MRRNHRRLFSPVDLTVLRWLARRDSASATEIVAACAMSPNEVQLRLATLVRLRFVASRLVKAKVLSCLTYFVTDEGRLVAGISDMRMNNGGRGDPVTAAGKAI